MGQDITAEKDGYVTLYGANHPALSHRQFCNIFCNKNFDK